LITRPDIEADFLRLLDSNRARLWRVCRAYAWSPEDADDLYQEILFQIWRALPSLRERAHENTWLYRVALNTAISFVRKDKVQRNFIPSANRELVELADRRAGQTEAHKDNPRLDKLYEALAKLDRAEKGVMTLYLEDLPYAEIAEVMGMSPNHVGVLLHRTKKKLFNFMQEAAV
jgi:RNA polymerase sigma-70 factor (ECF subfamily)